MKKEQNRKIKTKDKKTKIDKRNSKILQLNSEETATDDALSDFRFEVGAKTVPSLVYVGGDGKFKNLNADSSNSVAEIAQAIKG